MKAIEREAIGTAPADGEPPAAPDGGRRRRVASRVLSGAGLALAAVSAFGLFGRLWWSLDLYSHFRPQYALALGVTAAVLALLRAPRAALVIALGAAANAAAVAPLYVGGGDRPALGSTALRVVSINVHVANRRYDLVRQFVLETKPDLLVLLEVSDEWIAGLSGLDELLPYSQRLPRSDFSGIAVYSTRPFSSAGVTYFGEGGFPSIVARLDVDGRQLTLVAAHPPPPVARRSAQFRNSELESIGGLLATVPGARMVVGDLNTSPWSFAFGDLLGEAGLRDSSRGLGLQLSWPVTRVPLAGVPIDHCLVSDELLVAGRRVGPDVGSDHYPIVVDLAFRP